MRRIYFSKRALMVPLALASLFLTAQAPPPEPVTDQETELGDAVYKELKGKAMIIAKSPLYEALKPIATTVARVAQPHYEHPFKFFLVHDPRPNAFSVPGGGVYVTDALLYFVKNSEDLAAVLCHEVSHTIHRDSMNRIKEMEKAQGVAIGATILLGPTLTNVIAAEFSQTFMGTRTRAKSKLEPISPAPTPAPPVGHNPYGMIWLMQDFKEANPKELPQLLADHPSDEFEESKPCKATSAKTLASFRDLSSDRKLATPFSVPEDAAVVFLRR